MKLGILGTGMIVKDFLNTLDVLQFEKTAILGTEKFREDTEKMVEEYHIDRAYYDYDELLDSDVDTVYVALPNFLHYSFAKKALLKGKNAIIEKPITSNKKELLELIEIAKKNNKMIFEGVNFLYNPVFLRMKEDVKKLGNIKIVSFNYSQYSSRYNAFKEGEILPAFDWKKSGGCLVDINLYNINTVMALFGKPEQTVYMANIERNIDTSGVLLMRYPSFIATCIGAKDCKATVLSTIQGDQGVIEIPASPNIMTTYTIKYNDGRVEKVDATIKEHRLYNEFFIFKNTIENQDFDKYQEMIQRSLDASEVFENARKQQNIVFAADQEA